jgi:hypothetical protein
MQTKMINTFHIFTHYTGKERGQRKPNQDRTSTQSDLDSACDAHIVTTQSKIMLSDNWKTLNPPEQCHLRTANGGIMTGTETSTISIEGVTNIEATHFQSAAENLISIPAIILNEKRG